MISIMKILSEADAYYQPGTKIPLPPRPTYAPRQGTVAQQPMIAQPQQVQQPHVVTVTTPQPVQQPVLQPPPIAIPPQVAPQPLIVQPPRAAGMPATNVGQQVADKAKQQVELIKPIQKNLTAGEHAAALAEKGVRGAGQVAGDLTHGIGDVANAHPGVATAVTGALAALGINKYLKRNNQ
jgi:hypothetical protein